MMRLKRGIVFLLTVCLLLPLTGGVCAYGAQLGQEQRVFDMAGLFLESESEELEQRAASLRDEMKMDVLLVTTDDANGRTAEQFAEKFYVDGNYGTGKEYSGVLYLIDMDNRELYIAIFGNMNRFLTDKRWNAILDDVYEEAGDEDYSASAHKFLDGVKKYYKAGIPGGQYNYDRDTGKISRYRSIRWYEAAIAIIAAVFAASISCMNVIRQYKMKRERNQAGNFRLAYRADCDYRFDIRNDELINKSVVHVLRPRNHGGGGDGRSGGGSSHRSTTRSSSGRSVGGGGRKF